MQKNIHDQTKDCGCSTGCDGLGKENVNQPLEEGEIKDGLGSAKSDENQLSNQLWWGPIPAILI